MNRLIILGLAASVTVAGNFYLRFAQANPAVELQPLTPGVAQVGSLNISGTATSGVVRAGTVFGSSLAGVGIASGGDFRSISTEGRGVYGLASATSGLTYGGFFQNASSTGRAVYGLATGTGSTNYGGYFQSAGSSGRGVIGVASSAAGLTYGVYGVATSPTGYGVYSDGNMHVSGVISGNGSELKGVNAELFGSLAPSAYLKAVPVPLTLTGSNAGLAVLEVTNTSSTSQSAAIHGHATGAASTNSGGVFTSTSTAGIGVSGLALASTGQTFGGTFSSASTTGRGVQGYAYATTGLNFGGRFLSDSSSGRGIFAHATAASGTTYGVRGEADSPTGYGVYSVGDMGATGVKPFRIDHPFDPENKYLLHYATESPMPQNFYVGNVVTDGRGFAWVELPDYFAEINTNFKYQLTVVDGPNSGEDDFVMVKVRKRIAGNRFQIRSSSPNVEVSWRVDADRNDLYVRNRKPKDVIEKQGVEKGTYQQPQLYGLGPERAMNYDPEEDKRRAQRPVKLSIVTDSRRAK